MIKKILFLILLLFSSAGCYVRYKSYWYETDLLANEQLYIKASLVDDDYKNSPISSISIRPVNFANLKKSEKVELLSDKILVEYKGNKYNLEVIDKGGVRPYDEGVILTEGSIIVHFGKVKIDDKFIIDLPPIDLKDDFMLEVVSYNPILDALNRDTQKRIYHGPVKDYKGR